MAALRDTWWTCPQEKEEIPSGHRCLGAKTLEPRGNHHLLQQQGQPLSRCCSPTPKSISFQRHASKLGMFWWRYFGSDFWQPSSGTPTVPSSFSFSSTAKASSGCLRTSSRAEASPTMPAPTTATSKVLQNTRRGGGEGSPGGYHQPPAGTRPSGRAKRPSRAPPSCPRGVCEGTAGGPHEWGEAAGLPQGLMAPS